MKTSPRIRAILLCAFGLGLHSVRGADGGLDPTFQPSDIQGAKLATQSGGQVLLTVRSGSTHKLARLKADGTLDAAFPAGAINGLVSSVGVQSDDRIIIAGSFTSVGGVPAGPLARLNVDGSLDATFVPPANGGFIGRIAVLGGDQILVSRTDAPRLQRLNADGSPDATFAPDASIAFTANTPFAEAPDGKYIVGYQAADGSIRLARLNADGAIDSGFQFPAGGLANSAGLPQFIADAAGKVIVFGSTVVGDNLNPANYTPYLRRFNADGSVDATLTSPAITGAPLTGSNQRPTIGVAVAEPDGKILVGGNFTGLNGVAEPGVARLNDDGSVDAGFVAGDGQFGGSVPPEVNDLLLEGDGVLVTGFLGGASSEGEEGHAIGTARLLTGVVITTPPPSTKQAELSGKVTGFKAKFSADGSKLKIKGQLTVDNAGTKAAKNVEVGAFVSNDQKRDSGDVAVGSISLASEGYKKLAKKGGKAGPIPFNFKLTAAQAQLVAGKYVLVVIDPNNAVGESDETDNVIVLGPLP